MKGEWWEFLTAVMIFSIAVWIRSGIEERRTAEYIRRRVMQLWLTGQGPPNLYVPPRPPGTTTE